MNEYELEDKIREIGKKIDNEKDFQRIYELFSEMISEVIKGKLGNYMNEYSEKGWIVNFVTTIGKCQDFNEEWKSLTINPTDKQLRDLETLVEYILLNIGKTEGEKIPTSLSSDYFSKSKENLEVVLLKDVKKEIVRRKNSNNNDNNGSNDNGGGNQPPPSSNNSELDKKIANLQSQIKVLEDKVKQIPSSDNSDNSQQNKREIQQQIQQLKSELEEKEKEKEKEKETSGKNKKSNFPTGLVVGGGIAIFILLVVVIFLLARNNKNK